METAVSDYQKGQGAFRAPEVPKLTSAPAAPEKHVWDKEKVKGIVGKDSATLIGFTVAAGIASALMSKGARNQTTLMMASMNAAMRGFLVGKEAEADAEMRDFDTHLKAWRAKNEEELNSYKAIMDKHKGNVDSMLAEMRVRAHELADPTMLEALKSGDPYKVFNTQSAKMVNFLTVVDNGDALVKAWEAQLVRKGATEAAGKKGKITNKDEAAGVAETAFSEKYPDASASDRVKFRTNFLAHLGKKGLVGEKTFQMAALEAERDYSKEKHPQQQGEIPQGETSLWERVFGSSKKGTPGKTDEIVVTLEE